MQYEIFILHRLISISTEFIKGLQCISLCLEEKRRQDKYKETYRGFLKRTCECVEQENYYEHMNENPIKYSPDFAKYLADFLNNEIEYRFFDMMDTEAVEVLIEISLIIEDLLPSGILEEMSKYASTIFWEAREVLVTQEYVEALYKYVRSTQAKEHIEPFINDMNNEFDYISSVAGGYSTALVHAVASSESKKDGIRDMVENTTDEAIVRVMEQIACWIEHRKCTRLIFYTFQDPKIIAEFVQKIDDCQEEQDVGKRTKMLQEVQCSARFMAQCFIHVL